MAITPYDWKPQKSLTGRSASLRQAALVRVGWLYSYAFSGAFMTKFTFVFEFHDMFAIVGRGLVFRGQVTVGQASQGNRITILGSEGSISGTIAAIEKDRKLIKRTIPGVEIGILLSNLTNKKLERLVRTLHADEADYPSQDIYQRLLGVSMPARLVMGGGESDA